MNQRGRKSGNQLSVVPVTIERPIAPADLTSDEAEEWNGITDRLPADWFARETYGLLAQYCRHIVSSRKVASLIQTFEAGDFELEQYDRLLKMQERESRAIASLATKMRISQQSTYDPKKRKPSGVGKKPWEE